MLSFISDSIKGYVIGAANVVPGVSGGTMAYLLGIYERLIDSVKSFDPEAIKLLLKFQIGDFVKKTDLIFLISIMVGVVLSFVTLAKLLSWGFDHHPLYVWSIFFGLILASIPSLLKNVKAWSPGAIAFCLIGLASAGSMAFLTPASEFCTTNPPTTDRKADPSQLGTLSAQDFEVFTRRMVVAAETLCGGRLVSVLEGGYALDCQSTVRRSGQS